MKQLVILSGKGGTGKTTFAAALAHLASQETSIVVADADVDAANLELLLRPTVREENRFMGGQLAVIDDQVCSLCGGCVDTCRFGAILEHEGLYTVDRLACEGCAACMYQCPVDAIHMEEQRAGTWFRSDTEYGPFYHAELFAGQENSGKLVSVVRQQARLRALESGAQLVLIDGPPGIGCPVIAACTGVDLALHVVEPTISGTHDLKRILATTDHFKVPSVVALNKADLNPARAEEIAEFCSARGIEIIGRVPYDSVMTEAMVQGEPVTRYTHGPVAGALTEMWARLRQLTVVRDLTIIPSTGV